MSIVVLNGLRIETKCRFVKFTKGSTLSITEDTVSDVFKIVYPKGFRSTDIIDSRMQLVDDVVIQDTEYVRVNNVRASINGLIIEKLSPYEYHFSQYLVDEITDFVVQSDCWSCTVLIPKRYSGNLDKYIEVLSKVQYIDIIDWSNLTDLSNIHGLILKDHDVQLTSDNTQVFKVKDSYERYLIKDIDYIDSFINQLSSILESYGIQLVRYPLDEDAGNIDRLIYRVTELGARETHHSGFQPLKDLVLHKTTIEFECSFLNLIKYTDFKSRYHNFDLVSNFTEFYTTDKRGRNWISNVVWGPMPTDFNQDYAQDNQGNSAYSFNINAELHYSVVYDRAYINIHEIILSMLVNNSSYFTDSEIRLDSDIPSEKSVQESSLDDWMTLRN